MLTMSKERELGVLKGLEVEETTIKPGKFFESIQTITSFARFKFLYFHTTKHIETQTRSKFGKCPSRERKHAPNLLFKIAAVYS